MDKIFSIDSLDDFNKALDDILYNLNSTNPRTPSIIEPQVIQAAREDLFKLTSKNNFDLNIITEALKGKSFDEDKINSFISLLEEKKSEILYTSLINHNSKYGETIINFDWLLKLVCGTDMLKSDSYPLLQLIFSTVNSNGEQGRITFDVKKDMLEKLIDQLENIDKIS